MGSISLNMIEYGKVADTAYRLIDGLRKTKPEQYIGDACFLVPIAVRDMKTRLEQDRTRFPEHYKPFFDNLKEEVDREFEQLQQRLKRAA